MNMHACQLKKDNAAFGFDFEFATLPIQDIYTNSAQTYKVYNAQYFLIFI